MPKIEYIYVYIYISNFSREYLVCPQSKASDNCLQMSINFVKQRLKFPHFEDSIVP